MKRQETVDAAETMMWCWESNGASFAPSVGVDVVLWYGLCDVLCRLCQTTTLAGWVCVGDRDVLLDFCMSDMGTAIICPARSASSRLGSPLFIRLLSSGSIDSGVLEARVLV